MLPRTVMPLNSATSVSGRWRYRTLLSGLVLTGLGCLAWSSGPGWQQAFGRLRNVSALSVDPNGRSLESLVAALHDGNARVRGDAVLGLGRFGEAARAYLPALRPLLRDPDPYVRGHVVLALARIDRENPDTATAIAELLLDRETQVANVANVALQEMGPTAAPMALRLLEDRRPSVRLHAVHVLQQVGRKSTDAALALRQHVGDSDSDVRNAAILALLMDRQATLAETARWVGDASPAVSSAALAHLPVFGSELGAVVPELIVCLEHPRPGELPHLLAALRLLNAKGRPAAPALLRLLDSPVDYDVVELLETLGDIEADPQVFGPVLLRYIEDETPYIAGTAANLLARVDPEAARRQAPGLAKLLRTRDRTKLDRVLAVLRGLGPASGAAVPSLIELLVLRQRDTSIQEQAASVLGRIGPEAAPAVPAIVALLERREPASRLTMLLIEALGAIGPSAEAAVPRLLEFVSQPAAAPSRSFQVSFVDRIRCAAMIAAAGIGVRDREYLAIVNAAAEDDTLPIRMAAMRALASVGDPDLVSLPVFLRAFEHPDVGVRLAATQTCGAAVGPAPEVVARLAGVLRDRDPDVRAAAAIALGRLGAGAAEALPDLKATLDVAENFRPLGDLQPLRNRDRRNRGGFPRFEPSGSSVAHAVETAIARITPDVSSQAAR